uniref:UBC core domain-containing protein n=1 Tax=Panagrolaimus davidi TaxID=227884 RepID=A0A914P733_9BILA
MALMRLKSEFAKLKQDPPPLCYAEPINNDDFFKWNAMIVGPPGTPYTGTAFFLRIEFAFEHPFKPPKIYFISRIYHPNIDEHGNICMDILSTTWSPAYSVSKVIANHIILVPKNAQFYE